MEPRKRKDATGNIIAWRGGVGSADVIFQRRPLDSGIPNSSCGISDDELEAAHGAYRSSEARHPGEMIKDYLFHSSSLTPFRHEKQRLILAMVTGSVQTRCQHLSRTLLFNPLHASWLVNPPVEHTLRSLLRKDAAVLWCTTDPLSNEFAEGLGFYWYSLVILENSVWDARAT